MRGVRGITLWLALLLAPQASSAQQQQLQMYPKIDLFGWLHPCSGVNPEYLRRKFEEALAHVRQTGGDEEKFRSHIKNCPKRDLRYYEEVLAS